MSNRSQNLALAIEVDARVPIDDINDLTGLRLTSEESDRIGGIVFEPGSRAESRRHGAPGR